jgi:hypothetical protein
MPGVGMFDRDPVEVGAEITLHLPHEIADERFEVIELVLGRDDEAELVAVLTTAIEERLPVRPVAGGIIEPAWRAMRGDPVALDVAQVRPGRAEILHADDPGLDDDPALSALPPAAGGDRSLGTSASGARAGEAAGSARTAARCLCEHRLRCLRGPNDSGIAASRRPPDNAIPAQRRAARGNSIQDSLERERRDEDGFYFLVDPRSNMIVSGGENVEEGGGGDRRAGSEKGERVHAPRRRDLDRRGASLPAGLCFYS